MCYKHTYRRVCQNKGRIYLSVCLSVCLSAEGRLFASGLCRTRRYSCPRFIRLPPADKGPERIPMPQPVPPHALWRSSEAIAMLRVYSGWTDILRPVRRCRAVRMCVAVPDEPSGTEKPGAGLRSQPSSTVWPEGWSFPRRGAHVGPVREGAICRPMPGCMARRLYRTYRWVGVGCQRLYHILVP